MKICGIDEAGRGPVIGPMVMAGLIIKPEEEEKLKNMGVKDSKFLTPKKREELFDILKENYEHKIIIVSAKEIDNALYSPTLNLNWLEANTGVQIINSMEMDQVIVDCPSNNIQAYSNYMLNKFEKKVDLICEHKADTNYLVVGAASILAKVTRDREIEKLKKIAKQDFGSGYPSDPKTREFLEKNYNKFDFFRKSWSSYQKLVKKEDQSNLSSY